MNTKSRSLSQYTINKACYNGSLNDVKDFLKNNTYTKEKLSKLLFEASSIFVMEELLKAGANPNITNKNKITPLMSCANCNCIGCVDLLLKYKADKNLKDNNGNTALDYAKNRNFERLYDKL